MELNLKTLNTQKTQGTTERTKMRLSENATAIVFQMFTKTIYSNPIGTIVREITSNCFDSHVEAGVDSPVIIRKSLDKTDNTTYISFIDYGVGMSPDRIANIYGVYFESTKRADNTQIGGFGIGGKTPLAYRRSTGFGEGEYDNSFFVITNYNGIKYLYCISEGENEPEITLLHQEATNDHNGTEVKVPVLEKDVTKFKKEMLRQLYYFENIIFEGFEDDSYYSDTVLTNDYTIVRGKNFLYRGNDFDTYAHVCLGRVAYPIDYNVLNLERGEYQLPIAIRLEVGEINPTANREALDYNENTIKVIKNKLELAKTELIGLIEQQYSNITTLEDYFKMKTEFGVLELTKGMSINMKGLIKVTDINLVDFKYSFLKMPDDRALFRLFFDAKRYGAKATYSRWRDNENEYTKGYGGLVNEDIKNLYYHDGNFTRKNIKQAYLKYRHKYYFVISKNELKYTLSRSEIADMFNVHLDSLTDDKGNPVSFVQSLIEMQEEYFEIVRNNCTNYETFEVCEDFVSSYNKKGRRNIENKSIRVKFSKSRRNSTVPLKEFYNYKMPIFYGYEGEDMYKVMSACDLFSVLFKNRNVVYDYSTYSNKFDTSNTGNSNGNRNEMSSIMFLTTAKGNLKYFEDMDNAYHISEVYWRLLHRKADFVKQYYSVSSLLKKWSDINSFYTKGRFENINSNFAKTVNIIKNYIDSLDKTMRESGLNHLERDLEKFYDTTNVNLDNETKYMLKLVDKVEAIEAVNSDVMRYIDVSYGWLRGEENPIFESVLKKLLVF